MPRPRFAVVMLFLGCAGAAAIAILLPGGWANLATSDVSAIAGRILSTGYRAAEMAYATIRSGQERAPAVVIGLGVLLVFPLAAMLTLAAQGRRRRRAALARQAAEASALLRPAGAWLDVDKPRPAYHKMEGELLRIGRDRENDLRLEDPNVHLHHALIQRTPDAEFILVDVTGGKGNGTLVNGRRMARARLRDGDLIELGNSRVRFRCELVSRTARA
jgi:FHA domain-containing protein